MPIPQDDPSSHDFPFPFPMLCAPFPMITSFPYVTHAFRSLMLMTHLSFIHMLLTLLIVLCRMTPYDSVRLGMTPTPVPFRSVG